MNQVKGQKTLLIIKMIQTVILLIEISEYRAFLSAHHYNYLCDIWFLWKSCMWKYSHKVFINSNQLMLLVSITIETGLPLFKGSVISQKATYLLLKLVLRLL